VLPVSATIALSSAKMPVDPMPLTVTEPVLIFVVPVVALTKMPSDASPLVAIEAAETEMVLPVAATSSCRG
jgi:hypothetical protein